MLYGAAYMLSLLPYRVLFILSDGIYLIIYYVVRYRRDVVVQNLASSFPDKGNDEIKKTGKEFYHWLCDYGVETLKLLSISRKQLMQHIQLENVEQVEKVFDEGRNCSCMMGHYANWEYMSILGCAFMRHPHVPIGFIYHPLYNEAFDQLMIDVRSSQGATCIPKNDILRYILKCKKDKQCVLLVYVSDQSPKWENMHLWLDFLNHDTPVFTGGERIMRKTDDAVFYVDLRRIKRGYYKCTFKLITQHAAQEPEFFITRQYYQYLEETINSAPSYYLWSHKRWKRGREEFQRKYNIVNGKIIRKEEYK